MNKRNVLIILSIVSFFIIIAGISYSYFVYNTSVGDVALNTGEISLSLSNVSNDKTLTGVIPLSDNNGMTSSDYFDFTVNATVDTERIYYEVYLLPDSENTLDTSYLKTYLTDQSNVEIKGITLYDNLSASEVENGKVIYRGIVETNNGTSRTENKDFRLRLWLDDSYSELTSKVFEFDIYIYAKNVDDDFSLYNPCPGCKFLYTTEGMLTTWNTYGIDGTELESTDYSDSYLDVITASGKDYFLGVKLNDQNEVTNAYTCGMKGDMPFCIEGTVDGSLYSSTKAFLDSPDIYNNTCHEYLDSQTGYGYDYFECASPDNYFPVSTIVYDSGDVVVYSQLGYNCNVASVGYFVCNDPGGN